MREINAVDLHLIQGEVCGALCFFGESVLKQFNLNRSSEEFQRLRLKPTKRIRSVRSRSDG